jgi:Lon protease-like protein
MPVTATESLPLFPLHTVLLPGAPLGLRVFERRYLDLVAECGRSGGSFGICLILEGEETGTAATPAAFGVEARIEDFGSDRNGLLTLQVRGGRRFRVARTRVRDNGLLVGEVQWCEDSATAALQPQHAALATLRQLEDAAWVGWRLAELLPVTDEQRVALLQEDDPHRRLDRILDWMDEE